MKGPSSQDPARSWPAHAKAIHTMAKACVRWGVGFTLENPATSLMWEFPPMKKLLRMPGLFMLKLSYCRYGEAWCKDTIFLKNREELLPLAKLLPGALALYEALVLLYACAESIDT